MELHFFLPGDLDASNVFPESESPLLSCWSFGAVGSEGGAGEGFRAVTTLGRFSGLPKICFTSFGYDLHMCKTFSW